MGMFSTIGGLFAGSSGSVFMIIVLAVSDHLWGENVFNCPCGEYRILYTSAFLVVPPVVVIFMDTSWRVLFGTCQLCCDEFDGRCKRCCCCSRKTCETLVRLIIRPIIIAVLWLIFSCMEPKFGRCIFKEVECNCTEEEVQKHQCTEEMKRHTAFMRVVMASMCLCVTGLAFVLALLYVLCKTCLRCYRRRCSRNGSCCCCPRAKYQRIVDEESGDAIRVLSKCLYTVGVEPQTVIRLHEEKLMSERRLMKLTDSSLKDVCRSVGVCQLEILREHKKNIRLVRWLYDHKYKAENIKIILEKEEQFGSILVTLRESLETTDQVKAEHMKQLEDVLRDKGLNHLLPCFSHNTSPAYENDLVGSGEFYMTRQVGLRG